MASFQEAHAREGGVHSRKFGSDLGFRVKA